MPPLHLRQEFPTLKAFKEALHAWAIEAHFEPRILKSDTGRVRVGCKRDPNCPFVIRCNWERKNGREPLARVTVLRDRHTCLNALEWRGAPVGQMNMMGSPGMGQQMPVASMNGSMSQQSMGMHPTPSLEIRQDEDGNIVGGARVLGPMPPRPSETPNNVDPSIVPVLPKVQRNSASRLPFLMEILPRLMNISKETTPVEIRECLLREYGAEVHLQQCRRAKTEILKKRVAEQNGEGQSSGMENNGQHNQGQGGGQSLDGMGGSESAGDGNTTLFGSEVMNGVNGGGGGGDGGNGVGQGFELHTASGVVIPQVPSRREAALNAVGEQPVRCPYCVNHRWMTSIKDAVEHMSMHVVV
ncbi:uncharacterized protein PAC_17657 [Phialocephala subalpina]|uniref:Transposase MuDR plant domain-containing protein n=1 Tax=Phialocephala subalpina TaxID=576137 RepID=A0A1L7XS14_9HELO|nr:uncharacterized protein PAC_17657 [Phialocephala subalpina]